MIDSSIEGVEVLLKFDSIYDDKNYSAFFQKSLLLSSLIIHSSPVDRVLDVVFGYEGDNLEAIETIKKNVFFTTEKIENSNSCGKVSKNYFCSNNINDAMHNSCYNGCLNKKISIDINGEIKNCPSISKSFGNVSKTSLNSAYKAKDFKDLWSINKDEINDCKVCEFRLVCTDCRAFIEDPTNIFSKPLKCGYDPYTGIWSDWKTNPKKQIAINHYNI